MSRYDVNVVLYRLKKDAAFRTRFVADAGGGAGAGRSDRRGARRLRALGHPAAQRAGGIAPPARVHPPPRRALTAAAADAAAAPLRPAARCQ